MTLLLIWFTAFWNPPQGEDLHLKLDPTLIRPRVHWEDLDGDGRLDTWVRDRHPSETPYLLYRRNAGDRQTEFERLDHAPFPWTVRPAFIEGSVRATAYHDGVLWVCIDKDRWEPLHNYHLLGSVRKGIRPITLDRFKLLPTATGYLVMSEDCPATPLDAHPSVHIGRKRLELTYPVPRKIATNRLMASPIAMTNQGTISIWQAAREPSPLAPWTSSQVRLQFPETLKPVRHQTGDLNGDGFEDLVVLAMPAKDMSIFEELSFLIYLGTADNTWETRASQELKSKQNLWQTGPIEMDSKGLRLYYYKGLIRSIFKMDSYAWDSAGFISPKPKSLRWTMKSADRTTIMTDLDVTGDGRGDMLLLDERGLHAYPRLPESSALPFDEDKRNLLSGAGNQEFHFDVHIGEGAEFTSSTISRKRLRPGKIALIRQNDGSLHLWTLKRDHRGDWVLRGESLVQGHSPKTMP
ncbi:hypothetical protein SCOR_31595 [Sulfidibacter corallicola]|uniref:VCBS repeat-containing protein n=1 Tax=Sulfidibacter corallicola TaxID=2818388 RepID=A0A8A4TJ07_SULCO|nr:hypothetical protein [Sulfidibacter corallicola]QTD49906.1 hypothetical protein J3U87_30360 [Sulfidibacter corallicola]